MSAIKLPEESSENPTEPDVPRSIRAEMLSSLYLLPNADDRANYKPSRNTHDSKTYVHSNREREEEERERDSVDRAEKRQKRIRHG